MAPNCPISFAKGKVHLKILGHLFESDVETHSYFLNVVVGFRELIIFTRVYVTITIPLTQKCSEKCWLHLYRNVAFSIRFQRDIGTLCSQLDKYSLNFRNILNITHIVVYIIHTLPVVSFSRLYTSNPSIIPTYFSASNIYKYEVKYVDKSNSIMLIQSQTSS